MNVLTIFDQRIGAIFAEGAAGASAPFSFKRLAKRAVREMEDETFVIDGVDTAPALYTILVSERDNDLMYPLYPRITDEISQLIEAQAKKRGYTFVGRPLVRFMIDPTLRDGRISVFAENIDPRTLTRLRDEENAYLGLTPPHEVYVPQSFVPSPVPVHEEEPMPVAQEVAFAEPVAPVAAVASEVPPVMATPEVLSDPLADDLDLWPLDEVEDMQPEPPSDGPDPLDVIPENYMASVPLDAESAPAPRHAAAAQPTCTLVDLASGKSYLVSGEGAYIGRARTQGGVVLSDPNASRRHAELYFDDGSWCVRDLNSTNGTLVNNTDVTNIRLRSGDVITIGLTNLEFQAE